MKNTLLCLLLITLVSCAEKDRYRFNVKNEIEGVQSVLVSINTEKLDSLGLNLDDNLELVYKGRPVSYQIDKTRSELWFVHTPSDSASYTFKVGVGGKSASGTGVEVAKNDGNLEVSKKGKALISYRYAMTYPPEGVDSLYAKSGYIHPIITPKGDTLSRIQPPDHYHHYGLWGPWTHTRIDGERVDFWNLREGMGTVLFKEFNTTVSGNVFGGFNVRQEHINLTAVPDERIALNEDLGIRVWDLGRSDRYMFDYTTTFSTPLDSGILFEAYRYGGGLGMRFTERWHKDNCSVLTSEGKDRLTADGTSARWCIVSGESSDGKGTSGILFMSHPENRSHPEPMRVWPIDGNGGRGDMFFEFCPIRHEEWQIEPNRNYKLEYRMVVFDGELSAKEAEAYWQAFANKAEIEIVRN